MEIKTKDLHNYQLIEQNAVRLTSFGKSFSIEGNSVRSFLSINGSLSKSSVRDLFEEFSES